MKNTPDYDYFKKYYSRNPINFLSDTPTGKLDSIIYDTFLDCYNRMRLDGEEIMEETFEDEQRVPFSNSFSFGDILDKAYQICAQLWFTPNFYSMIPNEYYQSEPDEGGWVHNIRDYYTDIVVSITYSLLYSQSCLPAMAYRLLHYIEKRQHDDKYFFPYYKAMCQLEFKQIDTAWDIDFSNYISPISDIKLEPYMLGNHRYVKKFVENAPTKNQKLRLLITLKDAGECQGEEIQKWIKETMEAVRESSDSYKTIFFRDYFESFYGIDPDGKPLPPAPADDPLPFSVDDHGPLPVPDNKSETSIDETERQNLLDRITEVEKQNKQLTLDLNNKEKELSDSKKMLDEILAHANDEEAPDRTRAVVAAAIFELLKMAKGLGHGGNVNQTKAARIIHYLSDFSVESSRQGLSKVVANDDNQDEIAFVKDLFKDLDIELTIM